MKATITAILSIAMLLFFAAPGRSFAQASDTLVVPAGIPGTINNFIMGDTTATGQRQDSSRVYVLQQTGSVDSIYFYNATISSSYNLTIIGKVNPTTGMPPVVAPFINANHSSPGTFIQASAGNITLKGVYFLATRADTTSGSGFVVSTSGDSTIIRADHCVFDNFTGNEFAIHGSYGSEFFTNCEFRDGVNQFWRGASGTWFYGGVPMDTVEFVNNTFFCLTRVVLGTPGYIGHLIFVHNTLFLGSGEGAFAAGQMTNAFIKSNIFFGLYSHGADSSMIGTNPYNTPSIISLDTLTTLLNLPYSLTNADRNITVENNDYFWPAPITKYWTAVQDTQKAGPGYFIPPVWMNAATAAMFNKYPGLVASENDSVDPSFNSALTDTAAADLAHFVSLVWQTGTSGTFLWFPLQTTTPENVFSLIPKTWSNWVGYPVPENLTYSNTTLQSAGADGFALGDLNWYPSQYAAWVAKGGVTGVKKTPNPVPSSFSLSQNYPNPFNPSTDIKVSLQSAGAMSLTIYNVLGQVVDVVAQGYKPAGEYTYNVNMDRFASGVYFYSLRQGANVITKKMLLLK